jgi:hypothetical protein
MSSSEFENGNGVHTLESSTSKTIKFILLLLGQGISVPCYILVIYQFVTHRALHRAIRNHVTIVNLLVNFVIVTIDFTCHLIYLRRGVLVPSSPVLCLVWQFVDYGLWYGDLLLKLWTAIERHILIFHSSILLSARRRLLLHFIPLAVFTLYYYNAIPAWLLWYEVLAHYVIPILLMIAFASALPIRVLLQKNRLHVDTSWRHYRKMTIELIFIKAIYIFDLPYVIVTIVRWSGSREFGVDLQGPYFYYCNYIPIILFPFGIIGSLPKLRRRIRGLCMRRRVQGITAIMPQTARLMAKSQYPMTLCVTNRDDVSNVTPRL